MSVHSLGHMVKVYTDYDFYKNCDNLYMKEKHIFK